MIAAAGALPAAADAVGVVPPAAEVVDGGNALSLAAADAYCAAMARRHAENFTVASRLLDAPLRTHLTRIYAYCRTTDDLGDEVEGDRVAALQAWREEVMAVLGERRPPRHPVLLALGETVRARAIAVQPFLDLVDANLQDQVTAAYEDWPALLAYCRRSAAPVGRMVLAAAGCDGPRPRALSDDVCIGLQLANLAQDVAVDAARGRVYLLGRDLREVGPEGAVRRHCARAVNLLASGEELEAMVEGPLRLQLSLYRRGGLAVVAAIRAAGYRTRSQRPTVPAARKLAMVATGLRGAAHRPASRPHDRVCAAIARRKAQNFYVGFLALPATQRRAVYALYAFAHQVDDAVDGRPAQEAAQLLLEQRRRLRGALSGDPDDAVTTALAVAVRRHAIPAAELEALIEGVAQDLEVTRYRTWEELAGYCHLVAGVVGRMCVRIFGYTDSRALDVAGDLGAALQLTNILRDVGEDREWGRVYLPAEDLARFGVDVDDVLAGRGGAAWEALVHFEAERARALYASGLRVCDGLPRRAAACVRTMAGVYRALLEAIDAVPRLPLERRVSVGTGRRLWIALGAWR